MPMKRIAVVDIGSAGILMQIYEISPKGIIQVVDRVHQNIILGKDTYVDRTVRYERIDEICKILLEYRKIADTYTVEDMIVVGTSALREAGNRTLVLDQIRLHTGFQVRIFSNLEQRYMCYKALAAEENVFNRLIENGAAIVDVSAGSVQISLFDKKMISTQNMKIGPMRIQELIGAVTEESELKNIIAELIDHDLQDYERMLLKDREIQNLIVVSTAMNRVAWKYCKQEQNALSKEEFEAIYQKLSRMSISQLADELEQSKTEATTIMTNLLVYKKMMDCFGAKSMWLPKVNLCDGVAADYADKNGIVRLKHNFEEDILSSARYLSKRYKGNKTDAALLEQIAGSVFDASSAIHGLGKRERLLLQLAAILQDCGRFVSISAPGACSYNIICSTELIGLSPTEQRMLAYIVKFNTDPILAYEELAGTLSEIQYLILTKLTAILRLSTAVLPVVRRRMKNVKIEVKRNQMLITGEASGKMTLERVLFQSQADYFEQIFGIRPVIRQKKGGN